MTKPATDTDVEKFHHILSWPLIMRGGDKNKSREIDQWIEALKAAGWDDATNETSTTVATDIEYEEVVYFHPFARDFLYADGLHNQSKRPSRRFKRSDLARVKVTLNRSVPAGLDLKVERAELYLCKPIVMLFCLEVSNKVPRKRKTSRQTKRRRRESGRRRVNRPISPVAFQTSSTLR